MLKLKNIFTVLFVLFLFSCGHIQTRQEIDLDKSKEEQAKEILEVPEEPEAQPVQIEPQELPKVGVILGPGLMKAFAHIGVLKQLEQANVSVDYIAGIEWGSLMAGLYAQEGTVHNLEWKLYKFKTESLFKKNFLSFSKAKSATWFDDYLSKNLNNNRTKVPFYCPVMDLRRNKVSWLSSGHKKETLKRCLSYPPVFTPYKNTVAAAFSVKKTAEFLRAKGADLIILINVLGGDQHLSPEMTKSDSKSTLIWNELANYYNKDKHLVNLTLHIRTNGLYITSNERNKFIQIGERMGKKLSDQITSKFNF